MDAVEIDVNKLVIGKYTDTVNGQTIYGHKYEVETEGKQTKIKYIVGVGCILYDHDMRVCLLANEYNKQIKINHLNPGMNPDYGYFEDFGGKVEDKHVNMHIIDLALGELFEESAMMYNLHYDDLVKANKVLIDVPNVSERQYLCFIINFDLKAYYGIKDMFNENLKTISSGRFTCQKQFFEISNVKFFMLEELQALERTKTPINGFYGKPDDVYFTNDICGSPSYISSRIVEIVKMIKGDTVKEQPTCNTYHINGLQHIVSENYNKEASKKEEDETIRLYLQKYFVSRLDSTKPGVKMYIGGDIPMMYYNEIILGIINNSEEIQEEDGAKVEHGNNGCYVVSQKIKSPRLIIYTDNPCFALFDNVNMIYGGNDKTDSTLKKWFPTPLPTYSKGVFFQLNSRIYFSYIAGTKYKRIFIGNIKAIDDTIITFDNLIYKQTLAVDACDSIAIAAMDELVKQLDNKSTASVLEYFDDEIIATARHWNQVGLDRFKQIDKKPPDLKSIYGDNYSTLFTSKNTDLDILQLKGKYFLFEQINDLICKGESDPNYKKFGEILKTYAVKQKQKFSRCSPPFEFDCLNNDSTKSIFDFKDTDTFTHNNLVFMSDSMDYLPTFYLNPGLHDCFIIEMKENSSSGFVPFYLFDTANEYTNKDNFRFYKVAYETIVQPKTTFNVTKVEYKPIEVYKLNQNDNKLVKDDKGKRYWRRFVTITPESSTSQSTRGGGSGKQSKKKKTLCFY